MGWILQHQVDGSRQVGGEPLRVQRCAIRAQLQRHQVAGHAMIDHLGDPAHVAGNDRRFAGHGFDVDQAERLVDRRADEHGGVAQQLDDLDPRQHLLDPHDPASLLFEPAHLLVDLVRKLRGVGGARAEDELRGPVDLGGGVEQVNDPLLARDPAYEQNVRTLRVDAAAQDHVGRRIRPVLLRVDAVVDHRDPPRIDCGIAGEHIAPHAVGHGHHGVRALQADPLAEAGEPVAAAQLLGLPRPQRFQAMGGGHVRNAVEQLREVTGEVGIPGVAVDQVGVPDAGGHRQVHRHRLERGGEARFPTQRRPGFVGGHLFGLARVAKAVHSHVD